MPPNDTKLSPLPSLPVVAQHDVQVSATRQSRAAELAARLCEREPRLAAAEGFGPDVAPGLGPWPALVIEDHSAIALFETAGNLAYSYRALLLAGNGDQVVIGVPRSQVFEDYCAGPLGLGRPEILCLAPSNDTRSLTARAAADRTLVMRAAGRARQAGGLNLVTYMGSGDVWRLAAHISALAERPVKVAAPSPVLTRRANDKLWFAECVRELLGRRALPSTVGAHGLAALIGRIKAMAQNHDSLAIKLTRSASSAGNLLLDLRRIRGMPARALHTYLRERLQGLGWSERFPILVTAWEHPVLASPSVQLWLPAREQGLPVVEGIFDQIVTGDTAVFGGAEPSRLPDHCQQRLAEEAAYLGLLFQRLGYFGRCSFDSILVGESYERAELHWVECNARWGGVSIPLTLANRLIGDWRRAWPVIIEGYSMAVPARGLEVVLTELAGELYDCRTQRQGAVILAPGRLEAAEGYEFLVLDPTPEAAHARAARVAARLAGNPAPFTPRCNPLGIARL